MDAILIVEDSRPMQRALQRLFEPEAFQVQLASDGVAALEAFKAQHPSAVILDLKLPGMPGRELCREFKTLAPQVPIVVVSANSDVDDKVLLLELGADDYVIKPFSPKELLARVRAVPQRSRRTPRVEQLYFADVSVDFTKMEVFRDGRPVSLTPQEFKLLKYFSQNPERVISCDQLLSDVWGYDSYPSTRTVDSHILTLRQKLEKDPSIPAHFLTVHNAGYKFVP